MVYAIGGGYQEQLDEIFLFGFEDRIPELTLPHSDAREFF